MKDLQAPRVLMESLGHQVPPAFCPKETRDQLAFLGYQDEREVKASQDLLGFQTSQDLLDPEVRQVQVDQGVLRDPKVRQVLLDPKAEEEKLAQWEIEVRKVPVVILSMDTQDRHPVDLQDHLVIRDLWDS